MCGGPVLMWYGAPRVCTFLLWTWIPKQAQGAASLARPLPAFLQAAPASPCLDALPGVPVLQHLDAVHQRLLEHLSTLQEHSPDDPQWHTAALLHVGELREVVQGTVRQAYVWLQGTAPLQVCRMIEKSETLST